MYLTFLFFFLNFNLRNKKKLCKKEIKEGYYQLAMLMVFLIGITRKTQFTSHFLSMNNRNTKMIVNILF